jgi:hypothetical protein
MNPYPYTPTTETYPREGALTTRARFQNIREWKPHPYTPMETYLLRLSGKEF